MQSATAKCRAGVPVDPMGCMYQLSDTANSLTLPSTNKACKD